MSYTTNEEDQRKAAELKARLEADSGTPSAVGSGGKKIASVHMDEGAHKYVLMKAIDPSNQSQHFVVSSQWANYHRDAAEPMITNLQRAGYSNVQVLGGGRIQLDSVGEKVSIFGFSYGFGQADHAVSKSVVQADPRYKDFAIDTSDAGY